MDNELAKITLEFVIPKEIILNANDTKIFWHNKATRVKFLRSLACHQALLANVDKLCFDRYDVTVVIYNLNNRRFDPPNLYPTIKALIDGVTDAKLWLDDSHKYMQSLTFRYGGVSPMKNYYIIKLYINEYDPLQDPRL